MFGLLGFARPGSLTKPISKQHRFGFRMQPQRLSTPEPESKRSVSLIFGNLARFFVPASASFMVFFAFLVLNWASGVRTLKDKKRLDIQTD